MIIRFLGSGDAFGSGGRLQTCIAVRTDAAHVLVDCGASSLIALKRGGIDPLSIDAVIVSHLHGDHFGGLPFLVLDAQFARRARPLTIAGPPGLRRRVTAAMEVLFPGSSRTQQRFELRFLELRERAETEVSGVHVTAYEVSHASGAPAYALRLRSGAKVLAYSGDTEWCDALLDVARAAELFICEAYFFEKAVKNHLDYATLCRHRSRLDCRRLILTHMSADMLAHLADVQEACAADGMEIAI